MPRRPRKRKPDTWNYSNEKNEDGTPKKQASYETIIKENAMFEKYYKQLKGLTMDSPDEFDKFMQILRQPLPITFRITSYKSFSAEILKLLKERHFKYIDEITTNENADQVKQASANKGASLLSITPEDRKNLLEQKDQIYQRLSWYPDELGWQVNLSRQDVRKNVHFEEFKQFLIHHTQNGHLSRQEAVSMIPPLLLDVQPHHKILDMCASPGSKTAQLIEFLHRDKTNPVPEGFVIANDLENKRCYMLMHQLKRLESPNFMIINHDASALPNFRDSQDPTKNVQFDRILADVPCSGDGTCRKNIDLWTKWTFSHACNLHGIQSRVAKRAAELLAPGGLMVYSTCSLNPVENEAVVYNLLLKFKDELELVDARHKLTGMKTVDGLYKWNLMSKTGDLYDTPDQVPKEFQNLMRPYMFPPEESVARELHLERCIRVLPHHQNTGGFFIAVIRKKDDAKKSQSNGDEETNKPVKAMKAPPAKRAENSFKENPFHFMDETHSLSTDWPKIKEFYGIPDDFPYDQMMTRNRVGEKPKNVYFVSKQIRELVVNNMDRFKFINMGVPLFARYDLKDQCNVELRVCQESLDIMLKFFHKRIIYIKERSDLLRLLMYSMPFTRDFSGEFQNEVKEQAQDLNGSLIMTVRSPDVPSDLAISFTAWIGRMSIRPLINIHVRRFFLNLIGEDQSVINEVCEKIKEEDRANSEKSRMANPLFKTKEEKATEAVMKELDELGSDSEESTQDNE